MIDARSRYQDLLRAVWRSKLMTGLIVDTSPRMEMWMVSMLFSTNKKDKSLQAIDRPSPTSTVAVSSIDNRTVSTATAQAVALLRTDVTAAPSPAQEEMSAAQANALVATVNAMSSEQIGSALYSGKGVPSIGGSVGDHDTFSGLIESMKSDVAWDLNPSQMTANGDSALTDDDTHKLREDGSRKELLIASMQKAFDDHTLVIRKASDVQGLNYLSTATFKSQDLNKAPDEYDSIATYDREIMGKLLGTDGQGNTGMLWSTGIVTLILSWNDISLAAHQ